MVGQPCPILAALLLEYYPLEQNFHKGCQLFV
jgi:hypothetical protein